MIVTAWSNGAHHESGAGYGFRVSPADRDRYFKRSWGTVLIELPGFARPAEVNIDKDSFWGPSCRELISKDIGRWLRENGYAPWPSGEPPRFVIDPLGDRRFRARAIGA